MKCTINLSLLNGRLTEEEIQILSRHVSDANYQYLLPKELVNKNEYFFLLPTDKDSISQWGQFEQVKSFKAYYSDENIVSIELAE